MIHYHGTPMTPTTDAAKFFRAKHAMISHQTIDRGGVDQMPVIVSACQSFVLDNGAFTAWKSGEAITEWSPYYAWVEALKKHPAFDWALIPDVIDGDEAANDELIAAWPFGKHVSVPVWHMHESLSRLNILGDFWPRVALGSSGQYAEIGTDRWWGRMAEAMDVVCDDDGRPKTKLHGLRMLDPRILERVPLASADSTNVARNMGLDTKWRGPYAPPSADMRALVIADRIETAEAAAYWSREGIQSHMTLAASPLFGSC